MLAHEHGTAKDRPVQRMVFAPMFAAGVLLLTGVDQATPPPPTPAAPVVTPPPTQGAGSAPQPTATPQIAMLPPDAPPQIQWISLSSTTPRAGDTLSVMVLASSNVASVELRVGGYGTSMNKTDTGHFETASQVPSLPFFLSHNLTLQVIARNTGGVAVEQDVPIQVQ